MTNRVIGAVELARALGAVAARAGNLEPINRELYHLMLDYVHVDTGYLKSTVYYKADLAGADAPYAGYEADRGGAHDYAKLAINALDFDKYAGWVVEPF